MDTFLLTLQQNCKNMGEYKIKVVLLDEAFAFVRSLPIKVQEKIVYNYKKIENGLMSKELFKKLDDSEIWEFRTLYNGNCYRLFSFWDTETETFIIATHGIVKKSQKTPQKEIAKAEKIREEYFKKSDYGKDEYDITRCFDR